MQGLKRLLLWEVGVGVIWDGTPFETAVIPAKAGIQSVGSALPKACGVDSRFRGNDRDFERQCLANDTSTSTRELQRRTHGNSNQSIAART